MAPQMAYVFDTHPFSSLDGRFKAPFKREIALNRLWQSSPEIAKRFAFCLAHRLQTTPFHCRRIIPIAARLIVRVGLCPTMTIYHVVSKIRGRVLVSTSAC
jgi:hypothetical protein